MSAPTNSGIQTTVDGTSFIPSSRRADGSTRKEIRVRPGWTPQEDVKTYKSRNAEAWRTRGGGGVPGAETAETPKESIGVKSKNAKRREAAKRKEAESENQTGTEEADGKLTKSMELVTIETEHNHQQDVGSNIDQDAENERQKKIRNQLKKLKAVRELKTKKTNGEKLSPDQLMKLGKEEELLRDLKKLGHEEPDTIPENHDTVRTNMADG